MATGCRIWMISMVLFVGGVVLWVYLQSGADKCTSTYLATLSAKTLIQPRLSSPSTAEFPSGTAAYSATDLGQCRHRISGHFDAQNSLGAMVRSRFVAVVAYSKSADDWYLEDVSIVDE